MNIVDAVSFSDKVSTFNLKTEGKTTSASEQRAQMDFSCHFHKVLAKTPDALCKTNTGLRPVERENGWPPAPKDDTLASHLGPASLVHPRGELEKPAVRKYQPEHAKPCQQQKAALCTQRTSEGTPSKTENSETVVPHPAEHRGEGHGPARLQRLMGGLGSCPCQAVRGAQPFPRGCHRRLSSREPGL